MNFPIGLQLYSVREDLEKDFEGTLRKVKALGYDAVEFAGLFGHGAEEVRNLCKEIGLIPLSAHVPFVDMMNDPDGVLKVYADIGCKFVVIPYLTEEYRPGQPKFQEVIDGAKLLDKVIDIDQSPIGRTPRSNPATYTGMFDLIRNVFAGTPEAKARGYKANRFSFNVKGGRCEACSGDGLLKIEMHFLPDIYVPCDVCKGARYNRETLDVRYKGKNIHEVLEMTVEEALEFFDNYEPIRRKLQTLYDVGLNYIKLGQPSTQLSGGEAQRIKLATELSRRDTGRTLYLLDEPTTGLHVADVERLIWVLHRLVAAANSVLVIEHNLDVIKTADYLIDLGPEGGDGGGKIVATGTPEEVAHCKKSYTGQYLAPILKRDRERMEKRKNERE